MIDHGDGSKTANVGGGLRASLLLALAGLAIGVSLILQGAAMRLLLRDPKGKAPWHNGTDVMLYVLGMEVTAFAIRGLT